jgi:maltose O-acetyltransferase
MNGISIGSNCLIGLGTVVTKSLPDNVVAAGCPAKIIRYND